jgi:carbon storage regulator CsrA
MLVLTRKHQEKIRIGDHITITILKTKGNAVRVGIEAPAEIAVVRGELLANGATPRPTAQSREGLESPDSAEPVGSSRRGRPRIAPANEAWSAKARPTNVDPAARREPSPKVSLQRVSRANVVKVLPRLVGDGGPLRSMMEQRATV